MEASGVEVLGGQCLPTHLPHLLILSPYSFIPHLHSSAPSSSLPPFSHTPLTPLQRPVVHCRAFLCHLSLAHRAGEPGLHLGGLSLSHNTQPNKQSKERKSSPPPPLSSSLPLSRVRSFLRAPGSGSAANGAPCGIGQAGAYMGLGPCSPCPPGTYGDKYGLTVCAACPVGSYSGSFGAAACSTCLTGLTTHHVRPPLGEGWGRGMGRGGQCLSARKSAHA